MRVKQYPSKHVEHKSTYQYCIYLDTLSFLIPTFFLTSKHQDNDGASNTYTSNAAYQAAPQLEISNVDHPKELYLVNFFNLPPMFQHFFKTHFTQLNRSRMTINSVTHPHAYAFLNRLCSDGESKGVPDEVLAMWRAKGPSKNKLLEMFVSRCYDRDDDNHANRGRLEALIRFRQSSREFKKSMQGFSWLTETEMQKKEWSEAKIQGAKQLCLKKK